MSAQDWKQIGEKEYARLAQQFSPAEIRNILRAAEGDFVYRQLSREAKQTHEQLVGELAREFPPGAAIIILRAADRLAKKTVNQRTEARGQKTEAKPNPLRELH